MAQRGLLPQQKPSAVQKTWQRYQKASNRSAPTASSDGAPFERAGQTLGTSPGELTPDEAEHLAAFGFLLTSQEDAALIKAKTREADEGNDSRALAPKGPPAQ
jgi:hypothetical protein